MVCLTGFRITRKFDSGCVYGCASREFKRQRETHPECGWYHYMVAMAACVKRAPAFISPLPHYGCNVTIGFVSLLP